MTEELTARTDLALERRRLSDRVRDFASQAQAEHTQRAYSADWRTFCAWCEKHDLTPLPAQPETVCLFLAAQADAGRTVSTLQRAMTTLRRMHAMAEIGDPTDHEAVRLTMRGIRRTRHSAPGGRGKAPLLLEQVRQMALACEPNRRGTRDRALILVGYVAALRRSELAAIDVAHIRVEPRGIVLTIARSKTDAFGQGWEIGLHRSADPELCPVRAVEAWLDRSRVRAGPLFRNVHRSDRVQPQGLSGRAVAHIIKARAAQVGLDPQLYSGHSLRSGHITQRRIAGEEALTIAETSRHASVAMIQTYDKAAKTWRHNITQRVGL